MFTALFTIDARSEGGTSPYGTWTGWWFKTCGLFSIMYGIILPIDFHIFQDGLNHQPVKSWWAYMPKNNWVRKKHNLEPKKEHNAQRTTAKPHVWLRFVVFFLCCKLWSLLVGRGYVQAMPAVLLNLNPCQRPSQEPKLEVPTIYKAYVRPM